MAGWFTCLIYVIFYFPSFSEHFATKILPELSVLFLDMLFQPILHCKCLITFHIQSLILFHGVSSNCDFLNFIIIIYVTLLFQMSETVYLNNYFHNPHKTIFFFFFFFYIFARLIAVTWPILLKDKLSFISRTIWVIVQLRSWMVQPIWPK